ncbi:MAG: hypothetical protein ACRCX2_10125 [Paraclostridium sp.]
MYNIEIFHVNKDCTIFKGLVDDSNGFSTELSSIPVKGDLINIDGTYTVTGREFIFDGGKIEKIVVYVE